jgi:uroporphyrin-III C-methyltransferase
VVRLKGGDPMLFGRAQEEIDYLNSENIPVEIVPGVTAASGAAAQLARSLTLRGVSRSIVFATPRAGEDESRSEWARAVAAADTAALYMAAHDAESVLKELLEHGVRVETPIVLVENATVADERILSGSLRDLPRLAASLAGGAALILLGEVFREAVAAEPGSDARRVAGAQSGWRGSSWWGD